ncbi:outer membrane putative beta-barrel porin/alpha-amylase [Gramella sp. Hel_I_59]|uniref:transporter n=1 Tax=Gramella sp. Hel_I_59 TaxID=1249978 RepID=UPI001150A36B|nr:transporter [Gramella sp. Hel_I_59]TQI70494.1 outer membrane putative beta-barrel porin/alpha-amylase [Gramella sp. Hel_I_59]
MKKFLIPFLGSVLMCSNMMVAQEKWSSDRADGHAPISIMGDHTHNKGEFMLSYRYIPMWMDGLINGSGEIENAEAFDRYMAVPQDMRMDMHMLGAMYAISNKVTLAAMLNYIDNDMVLRSKMGINFTTESSGFGDIAVNALVNFYDKNRQKMHTNIGVSIPTGDLEQSGDTPMMENARLAYPMQLGSGTLDPTVGVTYLGQTDKLSWGFQPKFKFRLGENSQDYTLGNRFDAVAWTAYSLFQSWSVSGSLSYFDQQEIDGVDAAMNPMMMPLFDTINSGRSQLDLGLGSNFYVPTGTLKNLRVGIEVKLPLYQEMNGIQMKNQLAGTIGLQYSLSTKK